MERQYFASKPAKETAQIVLTKADGWFRGLDTNGYLDKLREAWNAYYGGYYSDPANAHKITFSGEQGELTNLPVNHFRNICRHILGIVTATRPALQARATNTDYKSLVQTKLANGLLDYYMREKRLEDYFKKAIEMAVVMGSGYVKLEWNSTTGEIVDYNEEINSPIYEGDVVFRNLSPFDVVFDSTKEDSSQHDWVLCRTRKNKYDLAAKYPELKEKILRIASVDADSSYDFYGIINDSTDDVHVYEFYHKRTESMPDGRYLLFLDAEVVLMDVPMPYRALPVYRVSPADILGTPFGYSDTFDILPIQHAINSLYSTIFSNQSTFGVQNVLVPRGCEIDVNLLAGAMNSIEYNEQFGKPEPLNLTATPPEIFSFVGTLEKLIETLSGVNSVTRGNPEASLKSGNALALVQSMALQFASGLQQSYVKLIEDVGTGLLNILKDYASVPRVAMIVGEANRSYLKEFSGDDLANINRVIVDFGNPLSKCLEKDTPVLMFDGSIKKVQDIERGDLIMGSDSTYRTVGSVSTGTEMMYKITSKDPLRKIEYGCNESHILTLKYCSDDARYNAKKGDIVDISVRDYNKLPARQKRLLMGFTTKIEFPEKNLEIPPYILGSWLGDGNSSNVGITTMDTEIVEAWNTFASSKGMFLNKTTSVSSGKASTYIITSSIKNGKADRNVILNEFKLLELINNKHIPQIYKTSSIEQRLELLAGILDTDGSLVDQTFVLNQKSDKISEDVVYLAKSLGFRVTYSKFESKSQNGTVGVYNKISIGGDTHRIPTKLKHKRALKKEKVRDWLNYGINVTPVGEGTYYGFTLVEEPHFVLGDFTVTHNTNAGKAQMASELLQMGLITTPQQYITVLTTGSLDAMTDEVDRTNMLIRSENERLVDGESVPAIATEKHSLHIKGHMDVLADPDLKQDPELVARVLEHIQEHLELLRTTDPNLLMMNGEQPLAPVGGMPANQPTPDQMIDQSQMDPNAIPQQQVPNMAGAPVEAGMPSLPQPPGEFANLPVTADQMVPQG